MKKVDVGREKEKDECDIMKCGNVIQTTAHIVVREIQEYKDIVLDHISWL